MAQFIQSRNFPNKGIKKSILLSACMIALLSTSYAIERDMAARDFGNQMGEIQAGNGNGG